MTIGTRAVTSASHTATVSTVEAMLVPAARRFVLDPAARSSHDAKSPPTTDPRCLAPAPVNAPWTELRCCQRVRRPGEQRDRFVDLEMRPTPRSPPRGGRRRPRAAVESGGPACPHRASSTTPSKGAGSGTQPSGGREPSGIRSAVGSGAGAREGGDEKEVDDPHDHERRDPRQGNLRHRAAAGACEGDGTADHTRQGRDQGRETALLDQGAHQERDTIIAGDEGTDRRGAVRGGRAGCGSWVHDDTSCVRVPSPRMEWLSVTTGMAPRDPLARGCGKDAAAHP